MARVFKDWLPAFLEYANVTEAPRLFHFWSGVSGIASCLRRKVWIDMARFQWTPSFYIIFVAPPGVVSKSTTADIIMDLVKQVPGIKFGPDVITWQALVGAFGEATESFEYGGEFHPMSPLTLIASELGNLINPQDREQINMYISLWDSRRTLDKRTKGSGNDSVEGPWLNLLGCTTPHWIADNMPQATVGGGFTSRCVFVYADKKEKFVAYVDEQTSSTDAAHKKALIADLEHIATNLTGPFTISDAARIWGRAWYEELWSKAPEGLDEHWMEGYVARKQTHMHKLAMILSVSRSDSLVITEEDLQVANTMLNQTEQGFKHVFSRIGRSEDSLQIDRFLQYIKRRLLVKYEEAYRFIHTQFPDFRDFEGVLNGVIRAGLIKLVQKGADVWLEYSGD